MFGFVVAILGVAAALYFRGSGPQAPAPGSAQYEQLVRDFYRGLAHLDIGLLDEAERAFIRATEAAPSEPAAWSNLGLVRLRLGLYDVAAEPIERAAALAPNNARVVYLQGRLATLSGRTDEGLALLRRSVELDPGNLRARFALLEELERAGLDQNDAERTALMADLLERAPGNLVILLESVRLAAAQDEGQALGAAVERLEPYAPRWPAAASEPYDELRRAVSAGDTGAAARAVTFLRNVLAPTPAFQEGLASVDTGFSLVADPFEQFVVAVPPSSDPSPADLALTFDREVESAVTTRPLAALSVSLDGTAPPTQLVADGDAISRIEASTMVPLAGTAPGRATGLAALDWNNDFRVDLLGSGPSGLRLLTQTGTGEFNETEIRLTGTAQPVAGATGAWPADIEMDGDLDIVLGVADAPPQVLRNNGDGTWEVMAPFAGPAGLRSFVWADLDHDGDPDAALRGSSGDVEVFLNLQSGAFTPVDAAVPAGAIALTAGDIDSNGVLDLISIDRAGSLRRTSSVADGWETADLVQWIGAGEPAKLFTADLDNNGALDLVASAPAGASAWLSTEDGEFSALEPLAGLDVFSVADLNADGRLDLSAVSDAGLVQALARGERDYHWQVVRPRAQPVAGDQRINSFGLGGEVEVRAGLLTQKQVLTGGPAHFGLGDRTAADVIRIVWPNGVVQAEFDRAADEAIVAEQRLKGSCPWVFAHDGQGMTFVTDFLWRSPLGLRINALDTAGVAQTEDWIRIRGDQLAPRDGIYDIRITAELWETHYIDHAALMTVDHPDDVEVFVDERFSPKAVTLDLQAVRNLRTPANVEDESGRDVSGAIAGLDGQYLSTFEHGRFQGIATDHFVMFDMPPSAEIRPALVAQGWVYPTDSSINVAVGQGGHDGPRGLSLEAMDANGRWVVVSPDLGFPAGKSKTMVIDLGVVRDAGLIGVRKVRLRTNLEVYWDRLAIADPAPDATLRTARVNAVSADLAFRGFSETTFDRRTPDTPHYDRIANVTQRWRDLAGIYTRFGDVTPLLEAVDDRYVIMNAGDELQLRFPAADAPPAGWRRDFVLIGDGWNKDGDFNTGHSATVLPLPSHDNPAYDGHASPFDLGADPVFRRHASDWERFHTRVVTPRDYKRGLRSGR